MAKNSVENQALRKVLSYQSQVAAAGQLVAELRAAIDDKEYELMQIECFSTNLPKLMEQREDLLADIAMGMDKSAELATLDRVIQTEQEKKRAHSEAVTNAAATIRPAVSGLRRKLATAEVELTRLKGMKSSIIEEFIKTEAELVAQSYIESAVTVARKLEKLRALGTLIKSYGGSIYNNYSGGTLNVPIFNLDACLANLHPSEHGQLKEVVKVGPFQDLSPIIQAEAERFKAQGVIL